MHRIKKEIKDEWNNLNPLLKFLIYLFFSAFLGQFFLRFSIAVIFAFLVAICLHYYLKCRLYHSYLQVAQIPGAINFLNVLIELHRKIDTEFQSSEIRKRIRGTKFICTKISRENADFIITVAGGISAGIREGDIFQIVFNENAAGFTQITRVHSPYSLGKITSAAPFLMEYCEKYFLTLSNFTPKGMHILAPSVESPYSSEELKKAQKLCTRLINILAKGGVENGRIYNW